MVKATLVMLKGGHPAHQVCRLLTTPTRAQKPVGSFVRPTRSKELREREAKQAQAQKEAQARKKAQAERQVQNMKEAQARKRARAEEEARAEKETQARVKARAEKQAQARKKAAKKYAEAQKTQAQVPAVQPKRRPRRAPTPVKAQPYYGVEMKRTSGGWVQMHPESE
ncbi:hypothetical protein ACFWBN_37850 [Streptomyces sp. NPDC059989]|uniref:hypothetical protein n=1 Tax=Streptomyces sp. NPDC059989 TaxID=3347026 RepID=UPI0036A0AD95